MTGHINGYEHGYRARVVTSTGVEVDSAWFPVVPIVHGGSIGRAVDAAYAAAKAWLALFGVK